MSPRPTASLSLDLDNLWAYQMTHGDEGWEDYGTYLDAVTDVVLPELEARRLAITFFIVGQDAALQSTTTRLRRSAEPVTRSAITAFATSRGSIGTRLTNFTRSSAARRRRSRRSPAGGQSGSAGPATASVQTCCAS